MKEQLIFYFQDLNRYLNGSMLKVFHLIFSRFFIGITLYRFERAMFLTIGNFYKYLRIIFIPLFNVLQAFSNIEIHYESNIKGGLLVLHPAVGVVISRYVTIGNRCTLTGGNVIGAKRACKFKEFVLGDNLILGANATIIGPLKLGNKITIAASACVVKNFEDDNLTLVGVPAKPI
jgi:serine acetyltransferase